MDDFLVLVFLLSLAALLAGLVRPAWVRMGSRARVAQVFSVLTVVSFFGIGVFADVEPTTAPEVVSDDTSAVIEGGNAVEEELAALEASSADTVEVEIPPSAPEALEVVERIAEQGSESAASAVVGAEAAVPVDASETGAELFEVVDIVDGDTIKVQMGDAVETLRLIGMDTPETKDPRKPVQCFGEEASAQAEELLAGQRVRLQADGSQDERDRYGRLLRYVWREDGLFFNDWMIRNGYAFEYTYETPYEYQAQFKEAQRYASENDLGLWSPETCDGEAAAVEETVAAPAPAPVAEVVSDGHTYYTSSWHTSTYYYCDTDDQWQGLSERYLKSFSTAEELLAQFPDRVLHAPCDG